MRTEVFTDFLRVVVFFGAAFLAVVAFAFVALGFLAGVFFAAGSLASAFGASLTYAGAFASSAGFTGSAFVSVFLASAFAARRMLSLPTDIIHYLPG